MHNTHNTYLYKLPCLVTNSFRTCVEFPDVSVNNGSIRSFGILNCNSEEVFKCIFRYGMCYKYQLNNQYMHEYTIKNICFYLQRHSRHSTLQKQLKTLHNYSLKNSGAKHTIGSTIEVHISSLGMHIHSPAQSGDWMQTPRLRTSGLDSLHYQYSSP